MNSTINTTLFPLGTRIILTHPKHRGASGTLGLLDRGRWWVHLEQPIWCGQLKMLIVSVRIQRKYIHENNQEGESSGADQTGNLARSTV